MNVCSYISDISIVSEDKSGFEKRPRLGNRDYLARTVQQYTVQYSTVQYSTVHVRRTRYKVDLQCTYGNTID